MKITFDDGYLTTYEKAYPYMKKKGLKGICFVVVDWIGKRDRMTLKQLLKLQDEDWEIGSHTITHPNLTKIDIKIAKTEIVLSKILLESKGLKIKSFAYPFGEYNEEIIEIVKKEYEWARACYRSSGSKWTKPSYNLVNKLEGIGYPMVHSIDQPQYRSNITMERFKKLCQTLV